MTISRFAMDYENYSIAELRRFVRDRTFRVPPKSKKRATLIAQLRTLDQIVRFRFLELPAELRNEVYRYLLSDACPKRNPGILRVSRLIQYAEVRQGN